MTRRQQAVLILITGLPATGKSTIAQQIARQLQLPYFGKDQFKEIMFDTLGIGDRAWSRTLSLASVAMLMQVIQSQAASGCSCVVESNFHPERDLPQLHAILSTHPLQIAQIVCVADGPTLLKRFTERPRHPGHLDQQLGPEIADQLLHGRIEPLELPGLRMEIDTTFPDQIDLAAIVQQLHHLLNPNGDR